MSKIDINKFIRDNVETLKRPQTGKLEEQIATLEAKVDYLYALWLQATNENEMLRKKYEDHNP